MKITAQQLRDANACPKQVQFVIQEWGEGPIPLTLKNLKRANVLDLDLGWFTKWFLSDSALVEYRKVRDSALYRAIKIMKGEIMTSRSIETGGY